MKTQFTPESKLKYRFILVVNVTDEGNSTEEEDFVNSEDFVNAIHFGIEGVAQGLVGLAGLVGKFFFYLILNVVVLCSSRYILMSRRAP